MPKCPPDPEKPDSELTSEKVKPLSASAGSIFPDESFIELTRDRSGSLQFLTRDGGTAKIVDQFTHGDATYTTPQVHRSICDSLMLPSDLGDFGSTQQLFDEIAGLFSLATAGSLVVPLTFLAFASWLPEYAPVAPFLWVVVSEAFTAAALKQTLQLVCRHALVVNALSSTWLTSLPMVLQPTLIAEVDKPSRRLLETLRASQDHCVYPTRAGQAVDPFCAKVIFSREPPEDPAGVGFPLVIFLPSKACYVPPKEFSQAARVSEEFQNKFFAYRVANFSKMAPPSFDLGQVSAPVRALAHSLAGAIVGDDHLQARIVPYLQECDADFQTDRAATLRRTIAEALVSRWREERVSVTDLTGDINTINVGRGCSGELSPETVGWRLKALGLRTTTIAGGLKGLKMADARPLLASIAATHGIPIPEETSVRYESRAHGGDDQS